MRRGGDGGVRVGGATVRAEQEGDQLRVAAADGVEERSLSLAVALARQPLAALGNQGPVADGWWKLIFKSGFNKMGAEEKDGNYKEKEDPTQ